MAPAAPRDRGCNLHKSLGTKGPLQLDEHSGTGWWHSWRGTGWPVRGEWQDAQPPRPWLKQPVNGMRMPTRLHQGPEKGPLGVVVELERCGCDFLAPKTGRVHSPEHELQVQVHCIAERRAHSE